jgi:uncharacterized protein YjbJ (UPF0337 family)
MNKDSLAGNWRELKGKMQKAWARLTDDDFKKAEGNWNELSGRLQKTYGYTREEAQEEIENFKQQYLKDQAVEKKS